jgi:hypothetical protein
MSGDFIYKPQPGDWDLPQELAGALDPVALALLSEGELEGIPVGVGFQASKAYAELSEVIETESDPAIIAERIATTRAPWEQRYPGAPMWDRIHRSIASELAERGHLHMAVELVASLTSPYEKIKGIKGICAAVDDTPDISSLFGGLLQGADRETHIGLTRALRDDMISETGDPNVIETLDRTLAIAGVEDDPISGWIESRKIAEPDVDWSFAESLASQVTWPSDIPDIWKRYAMLVTIEAFGHIDRDPSSVDSADVIGIIADFETRFGDAEVWDQLKAAIAIRTSVRGQHETGVEIALSARSPQVIGSVVLALASNGHQEPALDLAARNPDPALAVELLLDVEWEYEDSGATKLSELVRDDSLPKARRVAMMEAVRDRFVAIDALSLAAKWQNMISDVESEH